MQDARNNTPAERTANVKKCSAGATRSQWTRHDVPEFLNEFFQGDVTLSQLVGEARRRFPNHNHKPLMHLEVDRYIEPFVLDLLRIVATPNVVDALLTIETRQERLGDLTRP